jgi:CRISPR-associated protein Cas5d
MKVERVSYDVMTPSAARGIIEAIVWKPAIRWHISQIDVLKPIRWISIRRNEVGKTMSPRADGLFVDDPKTREQRASLLLREVSYAIHAHFTMTDQSGPEDSVKKFEEIFKRRVQKGQCFHHPYLGCREFCAHFELLEDELVAIDETRDLGFMLYDIDFTGKENTPLWFRAGIKNGCLRVPPIGSDEVLR